MCRVNFDAAWLSAKLIVGLLSTMIGIGLRTNWPGMLSRILTIHNNSLMMCANAMYSASAELRATADYSLLPNEISMPQR